MMLSFTTSAEQAVTEFIGSCYLNYAGTHATVSTLKWRMPSPPLVNFWMPLVFGYHISPAHSIHSSTVRRSLVLGRRFLPACRSPIDWTPTCSRLYSSLSSCVLYTEILQPLFNQHWNFSWSLLSLPPRHCLTWPPRLKHCKPSSIPYVTSCNKADSTWTRCSLSPPRIQLQQWSCQTSPLTLIHVTPTGCVTLCASTTIYVTSLNYWTKCFRLLQISQMVFHTYMQHITILNANFGPVSPLQMPLWHITPCNQCLILDTQICTCKMAAVTNRLSRQQYPSQTFTSCHPTTCSPHRPLPDYCSTNYLTLARHHNDFQLSA